MPALIFVLVLIGFLLVYLFWVYDSWFMIRGYR